MSKVPAADRQWLVVTLRILVVAALIGIWQLVLSVNGVSTFALASPSQVIEQLSNWFSTGVIWGNLAATLIIFVSGFAIGVILGTIIGCLSGAIPFFRYFFTPFIVFFNAVPRLVLIPLFLVIFGFDYRPGILVTALVIVFLIIITVQAGIQEIGGGFVLNARMLGASWFDVVRTVYLPGIAERLLSAARLSVGLAFQAAVVTEFFGSTTGLGYLLVEGENTFNARETYAAIILTAVLAYLVDTILRIAERRYVRWAIR